MESTNSATSGVCSQNLSISAAWIENKRRPLRSISTSIQLSAIDRLRWSILKGRSSMGLSISGCWAVSHIFWCLGDILSKEKLWLRFYSVRLTFQLKESSMIWFGSCWLLIQELVQVRGDWWRGWIINWDASRNDIYNLFKKSTLQKQSFLDGKQWRWPAIGANSVHKPATSK